MNDTAGTGPDLSSLLKLHQVIFLVFLVDLMNIMIFIVYLHYIVVFPHYWLAGSDNCIDRRVETVRPAPS